MLKRLVIYLLHENVMCNWQYCEMPPPTLDWQAIEQTHKGPFIATQLNSIQLNSTRRRVVDTFTA